MMLLTRFDVTRCLVLAALVMTPATALAQTEDHAPVALDASSRMTHDEGESWTYMKPELDLSKYRTLIIEPTVVYTGPDAQFEGIDQADRQKYANIITTELQAEVYESFPPPATPGVDTLRLRVTLLGAKKTKGGIATATRVTTIGLATSAIKSVAGKPGALTGSVLYAAELYDAKSGELLIAGVRRRSPDALDIPATLSTTDTVKAVAREFAENVRKKLEQMSGKQ
jgi:hypothetical protein